MLGEIQGGLGQLLSQTLAASGLIYGFLIGESPEWAVNCGAAHGALAMTTPGDTTTVSLSDVQRVMKGGGARVARAFQPGKALSTANLNHCRLMPMLPPNP